MMKLKKLMFTVLMHFEKQKQQNFDIEFIFEMHIMLIKKYELEIIRKIPFKYAIWINVTCSYTFSFCPLLSLLTFEEVLFR